LTLQTQKAKKFEVTYDGGPKGDQVGWITHEQFQTDLTLRPFIKKLECRWCGFKSEFTEDSS